MAETLIMHARVPKIVSESEINPFDFFRLSLIKFFLICQNNLSLAGTIIHALAKRQQSKVIPYDAKSTKIKKGYDLRILQNTIFSKG